MRSGTKKRMELEERMRKVLFSTMIPMACLMIILLFIFWQYTGQYNKLSENLAVSSEFNLRFKVLYRDRFQGEQQSGGCS